MEREAEQRLAPPFGRSTRPGNSYRSGIVRLSQVADALADDPIVAGKRRRCPLEIAKQLLSRATDCIAFLRDHVILVIRRVPLAESPDDQTAVRGPGVEPRQQPAALALELSLTIPRTPRDCGRIRYGPRGLWRFRRGPAPGR